MQENTKSVVVKMTARRCFRTEPIWQYDVGHVLTFEGFELPASFEVHFSRSPMGKAITQIGTNDVCTVPDMFAQSAGVIYAWLYIADAETGLTKYSIEIPVQKRAQITDQEPTPVEQSAIDQAIAALNDGVERSETAADAAESAQEAAEGYAESAGNSAITATNAASAAASAKTAAETAARNAATSATDANASRQAADQSATNAGVSERNAAASAGAAAGSATSAATSAGQASASATAASGSASTAGTKASEAAQSATAAAGSAASASENAGTASTAATAAGQSATAAAGSATAAAGSATSAGQSATAAAGSAQTAQDVLDSIPADYSELSDDVDSLKSALNEITDDVDELQADVQDLEGMVGSGMSMTAINLLNTILTEALYGTDQTANIALLDKELKKIKPVSISAVLDSQSIPLVGIAYKDLDFVVTATFDDESTEIMENYTVVTTGNIVSGSNTVTIRCRGLTTTITFTAIDVTTYTITYNLTDVNSSNTAYVIIEDERYETALSAVDEEHFISSVTVTMGGTDITSTVYINGEVIIAEVTGNIVITAVATELVFVDMISRGYANAGVSSCTYYSDYYETALTVFYNAVRGMMSVYPAKANCSLNWTITNESDSDVSISNMYVGQVCANDEDTVNDAPHIFRGSALKIPYCKRITNLGNVLASGASISGTYALKAGYQLFFSDNTATMGKLKYTVTGSFTPETFADWDYSIEIDDTTQYTPYGSYRQAYIYRDDQGNNVIKNGGGYTYRTIDVQIAAGEYDAVMRYVDPTETAGGIGATWMVGGSDNTATSYYNGFGLTSSQNSVNTWYHGHLKIASGQAIIFNSNKQDFSADSGKKVQIMLKEVSE